MSPDLCSVLACVDHAIVDALDAVSQGSQSWPLRIDRDAAEMEAGALTVEAEGYLAVARLLAALANDLRRAECLTRIAALELVLDARESWERARGLSLAG